jgi:hypothetical protein
MLAQAIPESANVTTERVTPPVTLLQQLIRHRDASYEQVCGELFDFARTQHIDGTISVRHLQRLARLERAKHHAPVALPGTRRLLREFFGFPFEQLVSPPRHELPAAAFGRTPVGDHATEATLDAVLSLSYGEVAVALYVSDMPLQRLAAGHLPTAEQIIALVAQGIARLGVDRIRTIEADSRRRNLAALRGDTDAAARTAGDLLPDSRRAQRAHDLSFRLDRLIGR